MKLHLISYRGAGLAIVTMDWEGQLRVLLGRRIIHPFKYYWSFPGGGLKKGEDGATGARREATEELTLWPGAPAWPAASGLTLLWENPVIYEWTTWMWTVKNPTIILPQNGSSREFDAWGWFPLNHLPKPLNYGVRPAVRRIAGQQGVSP